MRKASVVWLLVACVALGCAEEETPRSLALKAYGPGPATTESEAARLALAQLGEPGLVELLALLSGPRRVWGVETLLMEAVVELAPHDPRVHEAVAVHLAAVEGDSSSESTAGAAGVRVADRRQRDLASDSQLPRAGTGVSDGEGPADGARRLPSRATLTP